MSRLEYALHPGMIVSRDGKRQFVSFRTLVDLYGLQESQCVDASRPSCCLGIDLSGLTHLHPREDGKYVPVVFHDLPKRDEIRALDEAVSTTGDAWDRLVSWCARSSGRHGSVRG